jgi:cytochrome P450
VLSALAIRPDVQARLRAELRAHPLPTAPAGNAPLDADALSTLERLPLLDAVVRETLRIHAPVPNTVRVATRSDTIPLAASFTDVRGSERTHFDIGEGDAIFVPILMINRSTELWGDDAHEWRFATLPVHWNMWLNMHTGQSAGSMTRSPQGCVMYQACGAT